eukprot:jgi/Bigna1/80260/fgenesh1_pg.69_\
MGLLLVDCLQWKRRRYLRSYEGLFRRSCAIGDGHCRERERSRWQWGLPIVMLVLFSIIVRVCPPQTARVASSGRGSIARRAASSSVGRAGGRRPIRSRRDGRRPPHHRTNQESPVKDTAYGTVDMAKAGGARNDAKSTPDRPLKDTVLYPRATTFIPGDSGSRKLFL